MKLQDDARGYASMTYHTIMQLQYVTVMYDNVCSLYFSINSERRAKHAGQRLKLNLATGEFTQVLHFGEYTPFEGFWIESLSFFH